MNGVRGENKISSAKKFMGSQRKIPISGTVRVIKDEPLSLTFSDGKCTVCVTGDVVDKAKSSPATKENLYKNISKLGGTPFEIAEDAFECITDGESFVVASQLNELRRKTIFELREAIIAASKRPMPAAAEKKEKKALVKKESIRSAEFMNYSSVSKDALEYFHRVFLPEGEIPPGQEKIFGLALPVWETSEEKITASVKRYCKNGGKSVLAHSYSHIDAAVCEGLDVTASLRLNITSVEAANLLGEAGVHRIVLSPELTGAAVRDINKLSEVSCGTTVYGHLPIMTLRRCMMYDKCRTHRCKKNGCLLPATLSDRKGAKLKVFPLGNFMNLIVNPNTVWCADRSDIQNSFGVRHFIFTDESASKVDRIINSYKNEESSDAAGVGKIKRL